MQTGSGKTVVITGSTRGIGFGMARAFGQAGCNVIVSGREQEKVNEAVRRLEAGQAPGRYLGFQADVRSYGQVEALWDAAVARFGRVDIWINNAGLANSDIDFWKQPPEYLQAVVETNLLGTMYGCSVALKGMTAQGSGSLYNMEGYGSNGRSMTKRMGLYGSTKAAIRFFTDTLAEDVDGTPLVVGALRPGMVVTDMITLQYEGRPEEWARAKKIFNIIAEKVEVVAPWLVEKILANQKNGARFSYTSGPKIMFQFLTAPLRKRDLFEE